MVKARAIIGWLKDWIALAGTAATYGAQFLFLRTKNEAALSAEILFLRKQLAYYQERQIPPRRFDNASRCLMALLSRFFDWRSALVVVKPRTLIGWHRAGFRLFWRWKCKGVRPAIPPELRALIRQMARDNIDWGEERIANELRLKLGIRVSPRTVGKYMPKRPRGQPRGDQRWDLPPQPRPSHRRVRLPHGRDRNLQMSLRLCGRGTRQTEAVTHQRDRTSHRRLDPAAAARSDTAGSHLPLSTPRSRLHFLRRSGCINQETRFTYSKESVPLSACECHLRTS